jgi:hypothetical protein
MRCRVVAHSAKSCNLHAKKSITQAAGHLAEGNEQTNITVTSEVSVHKCYRNPSLEDLSMYAKVNNTTQFLKLDKKSKESAK